jgi:hypothetical protein
MGDLVCGEFGYDPASRPPLLIDRRVAKHGDRPRLGDLARGYNQRKPARADIELQTQLKARDTDRRTASGSTHEPASISPSNR